MQTRLLIFSLDNSLWPWSLLPTLQRLFQLQPQALSPDMAMDLDMQLSQLIAALLSSDKLYFLIYQTFLILTKVRHFQAINWFFNYHHNYSAYFRFWHIVVHFLIKWLLYLIIVTIIKRRLHCTLQYQMYHVSDL